MKILSINAFEDRSSVVSIKDNIILGATLCKGFEFPAKGIQDLKDVYSDWDYVTYTNPKVKEYVKKVTNADHILVNYKEALARSGIMMKQWDNCSILLLDSYHCSLGYYTGGEFYWLKDFLYPNSLPLFYSAATRFLGYDPLTEESKVMDASLLGKDLYSPIIENKLVNIGDGDYTLLTDLSRGLGKSVLNYDIATSAQTVFTKIVLNLASWLKNNVDIDKLVFVGRAASNYVTNKSLLELSGFSEVSIQPLTSAAGAVLGSASSISKVLWEGTSLGFGSPPVEYPDTCADRLLKGEFIKYTNKAEFSDRSFYTHNYITIPFAPIVKSIKTLTSNQDIPWYICQEKDYNTYFIGTHTPYGQSLSFFNEKPALVATTTMSRSPYLNRVLELTRASGYPLLLTVPIK